MPVCFKRIRAPKAKFKTELGAGEASVTDGLF